MIEEKARGRIIFWLASGCFLIFLMVIIGGITRLTGSGLSITEWKLISGTLPPADETAWNESFEAYKKFPEYQVRPLGFELADFKQIYWWEYIHRLLGRLIGVVFLLPFVYFALTKKIRGRLLLKLSFVFMLGALQGFMGWYMVKSGLADNPFVSHYRLALHLALAFLTFSYTFWLILELLFPVKLEKQVKNFRKRTIIFLSLISLQIIYGAFTAGLKAGYFYNKFPKMDDDWISRGVTALTPLYLNFIEGIAGVQFIHRWLGIAIFLYSLYYLLVNSKSKEQVWLNKAVTTVFVLVLVQVLLGIFTLVYALPLSLALLHQVTAFVLLSQLIYLLRLGGYRPV